MGEAVAFYLLFGMILASAVMVVTLRNLFHCVLFLGLVFAGVAGLFILLRAEFLAGAQVLIYIGAITVLILFAVMLSEELASRRIAVMGHNQLLGFVAGLAFAAGLIILLIGSTIQVQLSGDGLTTGGEEVVPTYAYPAAFAQPKEPTDAGERVTDLVETTVFQARSNTATFGALLLTRFIVPFEFASILLLVALVGAIVLAKRAE